MLAWKQRQHVGTRPVGRPAPGQGPATAIALLQDLGSRAGNRAVAAMLMPTVQRRAKKGAQDRARELLPAPAPGEVANLTAVVEFFGVLAARRLVQWARHALADKEVAIEAGAYLADVEARPGRLTWALTTAAGNVVQLRGLLGILAERVSLAVVQWAWGLAGGNLAQAEALVAYDGAYRAGGAKVLGLAMKALADAGGDVQAATAEMASLARYDHDPDLRAWAGTQAAVLAGQEVEARKVAAEAKHQSSRSGLGPDTPHTGTKLSKQKILENKAAKENNAQARLAFAAQKDLDVIGAETARPALTGAAQTAMEDFLEQSRAAALAPEDSAWILRRAEGRADLAAAVRALFVPGPYHGRTAADWVLARTTEVPAAQRLVAGLLDAQAAWLGWTAAQALVGLPGWAALDPAVTRAILDSAGASPSGVDRAVQWLTKARSLSEAAGLLASWHRKSGRLGEFLTLAETTTPDRLAWFVGHIGPTATAAAIKALETARAQVVDLADLERLLKSVSPTQAEAILGKVLDMGGKIDQRLFPVLKKATAAQVTSWVVTYGHGVQHLQTWLVDKGWSANALDPLLAWANPNHLPSLLETDTPATLAPLMVHTSAHLFDLRTLAFLEKEVSKYAPSLAIVAGADAVKAAWNRGTFADPLHSVVYHYCKHVRDVNRAETVAQYSADAVALRVNHGPGFVWGSGRKIVVGSRGGLYSNAGQPYSFWY